MGMKTVAGSGATRRDGWPNLGLCVLCGLPAAGKSTFARALALQLRRERGWAIGVLSYDDVLPHALPDGAGTQPRVGTGWGRTGVQTWHRRWVCGWLTASHPGSLPGSVCVGGEN